MARDGMPQHQLDKLEVFQMTCYILRSTPEYIEDTFLLHHNQSDDYQPI